MAAIALHWHDARMPPPVLSPAGPIVPPAAQHVDTPSLQRPELLPDRERLACWPLIGRGDAVLPPPVTCSATALSAAPRDILLHICSFLGVKGLSALARVAVCFSLPSDYVEPQASSLSVVGESARASCTAGWPAVQLAPGQTWLLLLMELTSKCFTSAGPDVELLMNGQVAFNHMATWQSAVVNHNVKTGRMSTGCHYLELEMLSLAGTWGPAYLYVGVVRDEFEVAASRTFRPM